MKKILTLALLLITLTSISQTHTYDVYCNLFKPDKSKCCLTYEPDHAKCPACYAEDKKKRIERENKEKAEREAFAERLNKQLNDEKKFLENQKKDIEQRNIVAENKINSLDSKIEELRKIEAQADLKLKSILDKHKTDQDKINAENDAYLKELRESAKTNAPKNADAFWDETLIPIKYLVFKSKDRDKDNNYLYGYKDDKGNIKIDPKFYKAEEFINGYAKAEIFIKEGYIFSERYCNDSYQSLFTYCEMGIINKNGLWVKPPQRVLHYSKPFWSGFDCLVYETTSNDKSTKRATEREREANKREAELQKLKDKQKIQEKCDIKLERFLDQARSEGYIIESPKN